MQIPDFIFKWTNGLAKSTLRQLTQGVKLGLDLFCWEVDGTQEEHVGVH